MLASVFGEPALVQAAPIQAPGGSWGTPGANAIPRAMPIREKPNDPVSPDFRPGLFQKPAHRSE